MSAKRPQAAAARTYSATVLFSSGKAAALGKTLSQVDPFQPSYVNQKPNDRYDDSSKKYGEVLARPSGVPAKDDNPSDVHYKPDCYKCGELCRSHANKELRETAIFLLGGRNAVLVHAKLGHCR